MTLQLGEKWAVAWKLHEGRKMQAFIQLPTICIHVVPIPRTNIGGGIQACRTSFTYIAVAHQVCSLMMTASADEPIDWSVI